jgi:hypothetical protein
LNANCTRFKEKLKRKVRNCAQISDKKWHDAMCVNS